MAIAFQGTDYNFAFPGTNISKNITTTGSNVTIVLFIGSQSTGSTVATPTYNGASFTLVGSWYNVGGGYYNSMWVLPNASIGTYSLSVTQSTNVGFYMAAMWYSGTKNTWSNNYTAWANQTGTSISQSATPTVAGCWLVTCENVGGGTAGANTVLRQSNIGNQFDSNGTVINAGSAGTIAYTYGASTTAKHQTLVLEPFASSVTVNSNFLTFM